MQCGLDWPCLSRKAGPDGPSTLPILWFGKKKKQRKWTGKITRKIKGKGKRKRTPPPPKSWKSVPILKNTWFCIQLDLHFQKHKALGIALCLLNLLIVKSSVSKTLGPGLQFIHVHYEHKFCMLNFILKNP